MTVLAIDTSLLAVGDLPAAGGDASSAVNASSPVGASGRFTVAMSAAVVAVRDASAIAGAPAVAGLSDTDLTGAVADASRLEAQVASLRLALVAEADRRRVSADSGASGTDAWMAKLTGATPRAAAAGVRLARLLSEKYDCAREAFAAGTINQDQTRVIVDAAELLPADVTVEERALAEAGLVAKAAAGLDARRLRHAARRMLEVVPPRSAGAEVEDGPARADRDEAARLEAEERAAERATWLSLGDNGDGTWSGRFTIPDLHGQLLSAALERLTAPRRLARNLTGDLVHDATLPPNTGETLSYTERLGLGLCELIEHLPTTGWDGAAPNGCEVLVTIALDSLLTGLGSAGLDTGTAITAGEARRLACNAGLVPAVLDTDSMPLDLGRSRRLHTRTQRRALALLHDTCAVAGCQRPFAWCEIHHHRLPWSRGGPTDLDKPLLSL